MPEGHHHEPETAQHEQNRCWNQAFAYGDSMEYAPHYSGNDGQVEENVCYVDFGAGHSGSAQLRVYKLTGIPRGASGFQKETRFPKKQV